MLCMCACLCETSCKVQWQFLHILQKSSPSCDTLLCGCSLNVAESKQSENSRHSVCVVSVCCVFLESVVKVVTSFL